jgi:3-oxoacyl-[acyl-carrier protein] reductase
MNLNISGLKAVITGASKGLGFATARELLSEGANVLINSRSETNLFDAKADLLKDGYAQNQIHTFSGDVTQNSVCQGIADHAKKVLGGIDLLITNSGGPPAGSFEDLDVADWEESINLSFKSHLFLIKSCLPCLKHSKYPSVLAVTSFTIKNPFENLILSNTIRAATAALIKSLSIELGSEGIRFNSILPGWTYTDRVRDLLAYRANKNDTSVSIEMNKITEAIPLRRMAEPDEFARVAAFLVSPAASYITGVLLNVDGGITRSLF